MDWKPDIFTYLSYRRFLADYYEAGKANQRGFSYRYLARRAGFVAANFLKLVIDGKRNLGSESVHQVSEALKLTDEEHRFFSDLVAFDQSPNDAERNEAFARLTAFKRFREARLLDAALYDYLSHWYYPVVRELAGRRDFIEDPEWIAAQVLPTITPREAASALETLLQIGLLQRDGNRRVVRGEATVTSGHEVQALGVANFHRAMLQKASESISSIAQRERDLSAMTVCVSSSRIPEIKRRLADFSEALLAYCDEDPDPEQVYQINIQLFPMSRGRRGEGGEGESE